MAKQVPNELITAKEQSTDNQFLQIEPLIRTIRGQQVLLDSDLAILYGVETKRLNEQVKRNIERFSTNKSGTHQLEVANCDLKCN